MRFLYYIPGVASVTREQITASGLEYALPEGEPFTCGHGGGPDGKDGCVIARDVKGAKPLGYYPAAQEWRKSPGREHWVGCYKDQVPQPDDLVRAKAIAGPLLMLADGGAWMIPQVRGFADVDGELAAYLTLPRRMQRDANGKWTEGGVAAQFQTLFGVVSGWMQSVGQAITEDAESCTVSIDDLAGKALCVLGHNYYVGDDEADILGLLTQEKCAEILNAAAGMEAVRAALTKKKAAATPSTAPDA